LISQIVVPLDKKGSLTKWELASLIRDLQRIVKQQSVATDKNGIRKCAYAILSIMKKVGIKSELLYLDDKDIPPIIFGEIKPKKSRKNKTVLFYNHYDVQPAGPVENWKHKPFGAEVVGKRIYGRGAADDKGELITRVKAVEHCLEKANDIPCTVKFIVEGEEESGSTNIELYNCL